MIRRVAVAVALAAGIAGIMPATAASARPPTTQASHSTLIIITYYSGPDLQTEVGGYFYTWCNEGSWGVTTEWKTKVVTQTTCDYP